MTQHMRASLSPERPRDPRGAWLPRELVVRVAGMSCESVLSEYGGTYFLLVQLDEVTGELAAGLSSACGVAPTAANDGIGFATVQRSPDSVMALFANRRRQEQTARLVGEQMVPEALRKQACFVFPLQKRSEEAFLDRITVGRSRNHDVVLRHRSVSKFHGWFECTRDGRLIVGDAGSKNRTHVGGEPVLGSREVMPGDPVRFGSVETTLCTPELLWRALNAE